MDKQFFFERNLLALSQKDPALCSRLSGAETTRGRYKFLDARSGELVPALMDGGGTAHPLHSLVDPLKEGRRLMAALSAEGAGGFLVFLGLGGGFYPAAALEHEDIHRVLVIDYDIHGIAELLAAKEYIHLFHDSRFHLLVDPSPEALEAYILEAYQPVLYGGIRTIPLRPRTELDQERFSRAGEAVASAIDRLAGDYSVQAYFGTRWFSNTLRNIFRAEQPEPPLPPIRRAALCAAGPSLDLQIPRLRERRKEAFLIATDTSLPALLGEGLEPDAVISIDCQHISYYHFMAGIPHIPLFLDLASPPLLASLGGKPRFFAGGHPLTRYISRYWRPLPQMDTSGANVTYAALSLAEYLGAEEIELYGADFSYPLGRTYARGTYIYPYFEARQTRLRPLEAGLSAFMYRGSSLKRVNRVNPFHPEDSWYYETPSLRGYREGLESKARSLDASLRAIPGLGAPISLPREERKRPPRTSLRLFSAGKAAMGAGDFLRAYRQDIAALPRPARPLAGYLRDLDERQGMILTTLLPTAAALKRRQPALEGPEILERLRDYCLGEIDRVLKALD